MTADSAPGAGGETRAPERQHPSAGEPRREGKRGKKRQKPPRMEAQKPPRRERDADPDSPFAALAALKERLEKGDGDR
jgi:ATP-dependent RNA helicase SUPV3L1/SUV3